MHINNKKPIDEEVYSSTELSDLLSSPVFYSVLAITFILGLSSVFGFFENPRKLKTVVDVISEKVVTADVNTVSYRQVKYSHNNDRYNILRSDLFTTNTVRSDLFSTNTVKNIESVSFNYDITSKQFWGNLDSSRIESAAEESLRESSDALVIGTPLSPEYHSPESDSDAKYSMASGLLHL